MAYWGPSNNHRPWTKACWCGLVALPWNKKLDVVLFTHMNKQQLLSISSNNNLSNSVSSVHSICQNPEWWADDETSGIKGSFQSTRVTVIDKGGLKFSPTSDTNGIKGSCLYNSWHCPSHVIGRFSHPWITAGDLRNSWGRCTSMASQPLGP